MIKRTVAEIVLDLHFKAHGPSGAIVDTFNEDDAANFGAVIRDLSIEDRITLAAFILQPSNN